MADLHLWHKSMISKGWRPADYNQQILDNWENQIKDDDWVFLLGDVCFDYKKGRKIIPELPGKKVLIKGNHDHWNRNRLWRLGYDIIVDDGVVIRYRMGKRSVYNILLSHHPMTRREIERSVPFYIHFLVYGHSHTKRPYINKKIPAINVCAEYLEYRFLELDEIVRILRG